MTVDIEATARAIHEVLRSVPTSSSSHRALHAKGAIAWGTFSASGVLGDLTTAELLVSGSMPATVRFSHPGGDPDVPDAVPSGRGMAVKLQTADGPHDLVGVNSPAFLVRDGASFLELLAARAPVPATGAPDPDPDPDRMLAFMGAHPESLPAIKAAMDARVPASYASLIYNGLHTFYFVDSSDHRHPIRWSWVPAGGEAFLDDPEDPEFDLGSELAGRLAARPGHTSFDLVIHVGEPDDATGDPTVIWPDRPTLVAGRLDLVSMAADVEPVIFDPTHVVDGIALDDEDEILKLRRVTYGLSYATRTGG